MTIAIIILIHLLFIALVVESTWTPRLYWYDHRYGIHGRGLYLGYGSFPNKRKIYKVL
jgi:hypothetical protein